MKFTITFFLLSLFCILDTHAQAVYGEANLFDYDNVGNRILRQYDANTIINLRQAPTGLEQPQDTVLQKIAAITVKAYPNPVSEMLIVENLSWSGKNHATLKVYDIAGKFIYSKESSTAKENIPFGSVAAGTYSLLYYIDGKLLTQWKIVKH